MPTPKPPDTAAGFASFYEKVYARPLPRHALQQWIEPLFAARKKGKGFLLTAFRGSSKTTTLSVAFTAFRIGQDPAASNLIIQAGERSAADTSAQVAELIEHNPGWKEVFPDIVPDRKVSWGADGYEVLDTAAGSYEAWRAACMQEKGKDPTLIGLGYKSRAIIGRHPTGLLLIDDIHDENNTRSYRELEIVIKIVTGTILPTVTPKTWQVVVGTPWRTNDALAHLAASRQYKVVRTPIETRRGAPTWPQRFPRPAIRKLRKLSGAAEFARMYLLDLEAALGLHLKPEWLQLYPHEKISAEWPVVMGVDYASSADKLKDRQRDYFAVAVGRALPAGGMVLVDGIRAHLSQAEAEEQLAALAARYPRTQMIGVEAVGKGEEFYHLLRRTYKLPLIPLHPSASKGTRFESGMAPLFERAQAYVVDVDTPFTRAFREEWLAWPHGEHDDTLDAVAWMLHVGEAHIYPRGEKTKLRSAPFAAFGRK